MGQLSDYVAKRENWYALLVAILRNDINADDAIRMMGLGKIGAAE